MVTKTKSESIETLESSVAAGSHQPLYLIAGDRVLAEPAAVRVASLLADQAGCSVETHIRPATLGPILADLKTYSLFSSAKIVLVVETAIFADESAAADLIDEALEVLPVGSSEPENLSEKERRAASHLLHTLKLFQIDPRKGNAEEVLASLPELALAGGKGSGKRQRKRGRKQIETAREDLATLLKVVRGTDLEGRVETDLGELLDIVERGLPEGHALVLAESSVAKGHPLVKALRAGKAFATVGKVEVGRGGSWQGLESLAEELGRETGVGIVKPALQELAKRTIQTSRGSGKGRTQDVTADSTARFAAEYRKLATLVSGGRIDKGLIERVVEDRGEEDAWKTLDAIGEGRADEALHRIGRILASGSDPIAERLFFFSLLATFCRQLTALSQVIEQSGISRRRVSYNIFKDQIAPKLQGELAGGGKNPLAGVHPFRLYRAYGVACRMPAPFMSRLPARVLETELRLKGDSDRPDAALTSLVTELATSVRGGN